MLVCVHVVTYIKCSEGPGAIGTCVWPPDANEFSIVTICGLTSRFG